MFPARPGAVLAVVSVLAAGCGSGGPENTAASTQPAPPRLTKQQYLRAGNKICRETVAKSPQFPGSRKGNRYSTAPELIIPYLLAVQNLTVQANKGLKILRPPRALEDAHEKVLAAQDARITDMGLALNAASSRDGSGLNSAVQQDVNVDGPRYVRAANDAGLTACSRRASKR